MIDVQNRTPLPGKAGRVTLALDDGTTLGGILSIADEATQDGTPWDRDTARKLQADIRTYPAAAGQSITAGDVVDVVGGVVTKAGTPSQAIALTTAAAGVDCEIIYSGVAALSGITVGQKITSDGVYGVGALAGVLQVWSKDRPGQVVTGSFTTSAQLTTIDLGFTPMVVIIYGAENNERIATGEATTAKIAQIPKVLTSWYADSTFGKIVQNGFSHWAASGGQGLTFFYIALQGG